MPMLKLDKDDPQKELEFEVKCALQLTLKDRIQKMLMLSQRMLKVAKRYADQRTYQIIKRPVR